MKKPIKIAITISGWATAAAVTAFGVVIPAVHTDNPIAVAWYGIGATESLAIPAKAQTDISVKPDIGITELAFVPDEIQRTPQSVRIIAAGLHNKEAGAAIASFRISPDVVRKYGNAGTVKISGPKSLSKSVNINALGQIDEVEIKNLTAGQYRFSLFAKNGTELCRIKTTITKGGLLQQAY